MKAHGGTAPYILNFDARLRSVLNFKLLPLDSGKRADARSIGSWWISAGLDVVGIGKISFPY